jgi:hypothetical protein
MSSTQIKLKASGLNTTANSIGSVPEGALVEAVNIVIDKNDVVESRRGFKLYGDLATSAIEQVLNYKGTVLRHYDTSLDYDSSVTPGTFTKYQELVWKYAATLTRVGTTATFTSIKPHGLSVGDTVVISGADQAPYNGTFEVLAGGFTASAFTYTMASDPGATATGSPVIETRTASVEPVDSSNKIRGYEAVNSNFYFTSSKGVRRLSAVNGFISNAGATKALDISLASVTAATSPVLEQNSQVGYRTLWGYKDSNNNIFYGSPSTRNTIGLTISDLLVPDFNSLLAKLDLASAANGKAQLVAGNNPLSDTNYVANIGTLTSIATAADINTKLKSLASKLETDMLYTSAGTASYQNPRYGRSAAITANTAVAQTVITSNAHGLTNGSTITISGSNSIPSIDGQHTIFSVAANTFTINVTVTTAGSTGTWISGIAQDYPTPTTDVAQDYLDQQEFFDEIVDALVGEPLIKITNGAITANSIAASTEITSAGHTLSSGETVTISGSNSTPSIDGTHIVTVTGVNTFTIPITVTVAGTSGTWIPGSGFNNSIQGKNVDVTFSVPEGITPSHFYQVYRTAASAGADIDPGDDCGLVYEDNPTAAQIIAGTITITDETTDDFRGADLYTNPRQEGILQANEPPPWAKDITIYKNMMFYANTKTPQKKQLSLFGTAGLIGTTITIAGVDYDFEATENVSIGQVAVETSGTPAQNADATARSLVKVINRYPSNTSVYAYYISGTDDVPGQLLLEARNLDVAQFNIQLSDATVGNNNFNPSIGTSPITSDNETTKNRIYYSKQNQFEAVPLTNYFNVGSGDKDIIRVVPLRDSLFVLKTDGVYRITGNTPNNLNLTLFDSTAEIKGPETIAIGNNQINAFSSQGVVSISDTGISILSRPVENTILPIVNFSNLNNTAFAIFYQTDRKYILFLPKTEEDTTATLAWVYNNVTNAWVTWDIAKTCGLVNTADDRLYLGASDVNSLEIERKSYSRADHCDREFELVISEFDAETNTVKVGNVLDVAIGDVLVQTQTFTNGKSGDIIAISTSGVVTSDNDLIEGDYVTISGSNSTPSADGVWQAINVTATSFELGTSFSGAGTAGAWTSGLMTTYEGEAEGSVIDIDFTNNILTLDLTYPYELGNVTVYKAFETKIVWAPEHAGNVGAIKQFSEATLRFRKSRVTTPVIGFNSELQRGVETVELIGPGLGTWGYFPWGAVPWGGESEQRGFRTYIPLGKQRCAILNCQFTHKVAREDWQLEGLTLVVQPSSQRINR